eukprot:SAG11_NODE_17413_length_519_cov_1.207143_1_plen_50_part_00
MFRPKEDYYLLKHTEEHYSTPLDETSIALATNCCFKITKRKWRKPHSYF